MATETAPPVADGASVDDASDLTHVPHHVLSPPDALKRYSGLLSAQAGVPAESLTGLGHDETDCLGVRGPKGLQDFDDGAEPAARQALEEWSSGSWIQDARVYIGSMDRVSARVCVPPRVCAYGLRAFEIA